MCRRRCRRPTFPRIGGEFRAGYRIAADGERFGQLYGMLRRLFRGMVDVGRRRPHRPAPSGIDHHFRAVRTVAKRLAKSRGKAGHGRRPQGERADDRDRDDSDQQTRQRPWEQGGARDWSREFGRGSTCSARGSFSGEERRQTRQRGRPVFPIRSPEATPSRRSAAARQSQYAALCSAGNIGWRSSTSACEVC